MTEQSTAYEMQLENALARYGLKHEYGRIGEQISSHYIMIKKKMKLLGLIPITVNSIVAEIKSEARLAKSSNHQLHYEGLEINVLDSQFDKSIRSAAKRLEDILKEKVTVLNYNQ